MSRNERMALLAVAALIAVVAFVALRPGDQQTTRSDSEATAVPEATSTPATDEPTTTSEDAGGEPEDEPKRKRKPKPPLLVAGEERTLTYSKGDIVRFRVRHPSDEEVHVHGYDIAKQIPAGRTVTVRFPAELEGIFEVELEHSHTPLGSIRVEP